MTNLFEQKETPRPEDISNPYEHLVGEGKKYKDSVSLAFAALKKDEHISTIERENAEARAELDRLKTELATRGTVEDALKRLQTPANNVESNQDHSKGADDKLTPEQVQEQIKSILGAEREAARKQRNVDELHTALEKAWGSNYSTKLQDLAKELGGVDYLARMAEDNPKAFLRLVGVNNTPTHEPRNAFDAQEG
jgi:hypothetical protein